MTRSAGVASATVSIGEVLAELRKDFPDVTISKLRFLETEGLLEPRRTAAGYRKYSREDIARLRYILTAQRDHYLPLRVIREHLAAIDDGLPPPKTTVHIPQVEALPEAGAFSTAPSAQTFSRAELIEQSQLAETQLQQAEQFGVITSRDGTYDEDNVEIATTVAQLAAFGMEPRHLRAFRTAADREVGLFAQIVAPLARQRDGRERAEQTATELAALSVRLHSALVQAGLRTTLGD